MSNSEIQGTWREDGMFLEFNCYTTDSGIDGPEYSSGYNTVGAGGRIIDDECYKDCEEGECTEDCGYNEPAVLLYIQHLDSGADFEAKFSPAGARQLAKRLNKWAKQAETSQRDIEDLCEEQRLAYHAAEDRRLQRQG